MKIILKLMKQRYTYEKLGKGMRLTWKGSILEEELMDLIYDYDKII